MNINLTSKTLRTSKASRASKVTLAALSAAVLVAGCSSAIDPNGQNKDAFAMVATTTQICDYVTQIAQPAAEAEDSVMFTKTDASGKKTTTGSKEAETKLELTCLLAPNASAHDHEMSAKQMTALSEADLLLVNGIDLEHFLDDAIGSSGFAGTMLVTSGVGNEDDDATENANSTENTNSNQTFTVDRGGKKVEVAPWPFPPEAGEQPEFRYDPHVWTSPKQAAIQVSNIGEKLTEQAPVLGKYVSDYETELLDLDQWVRDSLETVPKEHRVLFTSHDAFGYFAHTYGVDFIGAALADFNEQQDATAEHIRQAAEQVKQSGATALFAENSNNSRSIEAIAKAAGVRAIVGEDALYGDSLGPEGSPGATYVGSIEHNVTTMVEAWGGQPALR